jgi:PLP dependent protein
MIADNIKKILKSIGKAELIAVTKGRSIEEIRAAVEAGISAIGENRIEEASLKIPLLRDAGCKFHMIGHLQSNKAKRAVELFDVIQTVDTLKLAKKLDAESGKIGKKQEIFIQVNIGKERQKFGVDPDGCIRLIEETAGLSHIILTGLMCIAPFSEEPEDARQFFRDMKRLFDTARLDHPHVKWLSMGMTNDYEVAIEEGSNMVRIGRGIFQSEILNKGKGQGVYHER